MFRRKTFVKSVDFFRICNIARRILKTSAHTFQRPVFQFLHEEIGKVLSFRCSCIAVSYTHLVVRTGAKSADSAARALEEVLRAAGLSRSDLSYIVSTGYGRVSIDFALSLIHI